MSSNADQHAGSPRLTTDMLSDMYAAEDDLGRRLLGSVWDLHTVLSLQR